MLEAPEGKGLAGPALPGTIRRFQSLGSVRGGPRGYRSRHEAMFFFLFLFFFLPGRNEAGHRYVEGTKRQAKASRGGLGAKLAF